MIQAEPLAVLPLSADAFAPYGWMLGKDFKLETAIAGFTNSATDFWQEHIFDPGQSDQTEVLWVNYRSQAEVSMLEVHRLTEQAIVPLTGTVLHIVGLSLPTGEPDLSSLKAFRINPGQGICMRPDCWHASRVESGQVTCLMLTRSTTTMELVAHMTLGAPAKESALEAIAPRRLVADAHP